MRTLRLSLLGVAVATLVLPAASSDTPTEAPAGFDNLTNGFTTQADFDADRGIFGERESIGDGLGPVYNAQSCAECHQNPGMNPPRATEVTLRCARRTLTPENVVTAS